MSEYYKRGDIILANFDPAIGSEQAGRRPAVVIQNDIGNKYSHTIIVAIITTSIKKDLPTHIYINEDYLESNSVLMLEQIRTIDIDRVQKHFGSLSEEIMKNVDNALAISVGLKKRKQNGLIMVLCQTCAQVFYDSPYHNIRRADPTQTLKEHCTYCNVRDGFDYVITAKKDLNENK